MENKPTDQEVRAQNDAFYFKYNDRILELKKSGQNAPVFKDEFGFLYWLTRDQRRKLAKLKKQGKI